MQQTVQWSAKQDEVPPRLKAHLAFYLTGNRSRGALDAIGELGLRPALFAGYRDLTALRYDFPLVLIQGAADSPTVQSLSGLFDNLLKRCADGPEGDPPSRWAAHWGITIRQLDRGRTAPRHARRRASAGQLEPVAGGARRRRRSRRLRRRDGFAAVSTSVEGKVREQSAAIWRPARRADHEAFQHLARRSRPLERGANGRASARLLRVNPSRRFRFRCDVAAAGRNIADRHPLRSAS